MKTTHRPIAWKSGLLALALALGVLGGCKASAHAGGYSGSKRSDRPRSSGSESPPPKYGSSSSALRQHDGTDAHPDNDASPSAPAATNPPVVATPADHDRGHGNDPDGVDEDNPGNSKDKAKEEAKTKKAARKAKREAAQAGDHDHGHGNDADKVDEDNPGRSKTK
jgi:hypothetical protein